MKGQGHYGFCFSFFLVVSCGGMLVLIQLSLVLARVFLVGRPWVSLSPALDEPLWLPALHSPLGKDLRAVSLD